MRPNNINEGNRGKRVFLGRHLVGLHYLQMLWNRIGGRDVLDGFL